MKVILEQPADCANSSQLKASSMLINNGLFTVLCVSPGGGCTGSYKATAAAARSFNMLYKSIRYSLRSVSVWLFLLVLMLSQSAAFAANKNSGVYILQVDKPLSEVYDSVYKSLEDARFFVVFEPNIGANLARFSKKWGDDYNRNNIAEIRSMVFCNGWYANKVSNLDPEMLGFCPLHLTVIEREGKTTILFNRPGVIAQNSPAKELLLKIESEVISAIQLGAK